ncbi:MAG: TonB-dependent receptor [Acidobacteriales bacterium]|nr:TonB-dependent receptor [Terriglobales bacterium]
MGSPVVASFLLMSIFFSPVLACVSGIVTDVSGSVLLNADVEIRDAAGVLIWTGRTSGDGRFQWCTATAGHYQVRVHGANLEARESAVYVPSSGADVQLRIALGPPSVHSRITVSATRGSVEDTERSPQMAFAKDPDEIRTRPIATLGESLAAEPGVLVQQTTRGQVSPFLRGLTGYQVLNLVDGIRFNNSTFRSGPNQYLAFIEPNQARRVEALLGPTGVQYGSDSLGGTIHVITSRPEFETGNNRWRTHGDLSAGAASGDLSAAGNGRITVADERTFLLIGASGRKHNDVRAGGGYDSHNVFHRYFRMSLGSVRNLMGGRQRDSGFRQYGLETRLALRPREGHLFSFSYQRGVQDQVRGYKDLLGGLGRLQSDFDPQVLNWFYARYEKQRLGFLDSLTGTFSLNSQADGSARRNLLYSDPLTRDWSRVDAWGYSIQAVTRRTSRALLSFGGDIYDEHVSSTRTVTEPISGNITHPRPLYPDGSRYQTFGAFGQLNVDLTPRLRAGGGIRYTGVRFAAREDSVLAIPESTQWFRDFTYQSSLSYQVAGPLGLHAVVSRGFRAPNLNDLGALGLNDLGYEIPASAAIPAGALLSTDSGEGALSKNQALRPLTAESLMNYEAGVRLNFRRLYIRAQAFDAELFDPITRRTLLFPANAVPGELAGLPVTPIAPTAAQLAQGVVAVATPLDSRAVKAFVNDGRSRYYGNEALAHLILTPRLALEANYSSILGRDLNPNRNVRRLPPQMGAVALRYTPNGRRPWLEIAVAASGAQDRLSGGDVDDERIGASLRRSDIASFFNGSRVAAYRDPATGVFLPTGETLLQIQNRVLPIGATLNGVRVVSDGTRVPLYLSTAGWATLNIRSGFPLGERVHLNVAVENLLDSNYRVHGSGTDAPGISAWIGAGYRF